MDILDILLDILLKSPQPFIGLFLIEPSNLYPEFHFIPTVQQNLVNLLPRQKFAKC